MPAGLPAWTQMAMTIKNRFGKTPAPVLVIFNKEDGMLFIKFMSPEANKG